MTRLRHLPTLRWTIGLIVAFACCTVAAGHGIGPIGFFLVFGFADTPALGVVGCAVLAMLPIAQRMHDRALYAIGLAGLGALWGIAYHVAEVRWILMLTSVPFLFLLAVQLRGVVFGEAD